MGWLLPDSRYDEIRSAVADLIEDWGISVYPFSIRSLLQRMGITVVPYSALSSDIGAFLKENGQDAFTAYPPDFNPRKTTTCYNDKVSSRGRMRFTFAHELAHLVLEHPDSGEEVYEHEADIFANYLLAPAPLIIKYSEFDYMTASVDFSISYSCAKSACDGAARRCCFGPAEQTEYERRILTACALEKGGGQLALV